MGSLYDDVTNIIINAVEEGAETYQMPWSRTASSTHPQNAISGRPYRGVNTVVLWAAGQAAAYQSALWATYKQWTAAGAQVRKGERSTVILLYRPAGDNQARELSDDAPAQRAVARAFRVFNADQVDGFTPAELPVLTEIQRISNAEAFCSAQAATLWFGSDIAFYDPRSDTISMPSFQAFKSANAYYSVLGHELGHWTGAKSRLDRDLSGRFGSDTYAMEQLVAELTAAFIAAHLGLNNEPRRDHAPYLSSWLRVLRKDNRAILTAASKAQAAADFLIQRAASAAAEASSCAAQSEYLAMPELAA